MDSSIQVLVKPDWISWDDVHQVLVKAHALNRANGIQMRKPSLPGDIISKEIGDDGVMLVAIDGTKVVGTAAIVPKNGSSWYNKGLYGYLCFASVLPDYGGKGVYRRLCEEREKIARAKGIQGLLFDTHHRNEHVIRINEKYGFKRVSVKNCSDHWNIVMFKWIDGCPFSEWRCTYEYTRRKALLMIKRKIDSILAKNKCK